MPINNITQTISTLPPAGSRGVDVQTQFVIKQEDFQDHLQGITVDELNTLKDQLNSRIGEINSTTTTMNGYASTASAGASTATTKAGEASTSAGEALAYRNQAETFKNNASTSATKASQWADNNYNVEVEAGRYSAKHWSTVAQNATANKIDKVTSTDNAVVRFNGTTGDIQNSGVIIDDNGNIGINTSNPSSFSNYGSITINGTNGGITSYTVNNVETGRVQAFSGGFNIAAKGANTILTLETNGVERMRIDANGNTALGGATPYPWASNRKEIDIGIVYGGLSAGTALDLVANAYFNGTNWIYKNSTYANYYMLNNGTHSWFNAAAGIAGNAVTFTTVMTLDTNGRLDVNPTGNSEAFRAYTTGTSNISYASTSSQVASTNWLHFYGLSSNGTVANIAIYGNGNVQNANNSYGAISDVKLKENIVDTSPKLDKLMQARVVNYNLIGDKQKQIGVIAQEIEKIFPGVVDETKDTKQIEVEKERIIPALEEITEQKLVQEAVLGDDGTILEEAIYETIVTQNARPETVEKYTETETKETGETTKNVKYSVIYMMMLKGMQEQQEIINDLKARIEILEGAK